MEKAHFFYGADNRHLDQENPFLCERRDGDISLKDDLQDVRRVLEEAKNFVCSNYSKLNIKLLLTLLFLLTGYLVKICNHQLSF